MATAPAPQIDTRSRNEKNELIVISHSSLFYWWPVWAVGFIMSGITFLSEQRLTTVPDGTVPATSQEIKGFDGPRDVLALPKDKHLVKDRDGNPARPHMRMSANKNLGVLFCIVLL